MSSIDQFVTDIQAADSRIEGFREKIAQLTSELEALVAQRNVLVAEAVPVFEAALARLVATLPAPVDVEPDPPVTLDPVEPDTI